jgi:type II secretory pathway component GspD/PulD (secretin)
MAPPKSIFYKPAQGMLLILASSKDLDIIEKTVAALNTPEPQIEIKTRFVAVADQDAAAFWKNLGPLIGATNLSAQATPHEAALLLHAIKQKPKADLLSETSVTTLSGRQVQVQCVDLTTVITGIDPKALTPPGVVSNAFLTKTLPFGPTVDFVPSIGPGGQTIRLGVIASINEFLGYEKPTNSVTIYVNGKKGHTIPPLPQFHVSAITNSLEIRDGNTVVLGGIQSQKVSVLKDKVPFLGDLPMLGSLFRSPSRLCETNQLLVFITPTLIDPAGNRLHPLPKESASSK